MHHPQARFCVRCRDLRKRPESRREADGSKWRIDKVAREKQMRKQWSAKQGAFVCVYTGLPLTTDRLDDGRAGPLYATWEHRDPRDPKKASQVVLVGSLVNDMKNDMTEREFWRMVKALATHFEDLKANPSVQLNRTVLPRAWARGRRLRQPD
jgi:hypothetical protein